MSPIGRLAELGQPLRNRPFRLVWAAQVASEFGDWAARLALAVLVFDRTGSPALSAFSLTVSLLPAVVLGPYLSALGDRFPRRRVLIVTDVVRGVIYGCMALPAPTWTLFPLVFLAETATPPFEAVRSAMLPTLVPERIYAKAVVLSGITFQVALLAGFAFGGALISATGARGALGVNAATFGISALILLRLPLERRLEREDATPIATLRESRSFLREDRIVLQAVRFICTAAGFAVVVTALVPAYAEDELGKGPSVAGLLSAAIPLGTIVMAALVHHDPTASASPLRPIATATSACAAIGVIGFALDLELPWVAVSFAASGAVFAGLLSANAVLGPRIPDAVRAATFGLVQMALTAAQGLGALAGGLIAEALGVRATCVVALLGVVISSLAVARQRDT